MNRTIISVYGREYYTIPRAAKELDIPISTARHVLNKRWLDEHNVDRELKDILLSPARKRIRKYVSSTLIEKLKPLMYKELG